MRALTINAKSSPEDLNLLKRFIRCLGAQENVLEAGEEITCRIDGTFQDIELAQTFVRRKAKKGFKYEVLSKKVIGRGGYSTVYDVDGVIEILPDGSVQFKVKAEDKKRVAKIYSRAKTSIKTCMQEYQLTRVISHLHLKEPVVSDNELIVFQRKQCGMELYKWLKNLESKPSLLSVEKRLDLSLALLDALHRQVHAHGIIHRDIKPENIMVEFDEKTKKFRVAIIDYNLMRRLECPDNKACGTRVYMSLEAFKGQADASSDGFSMALVLGALWGADWSDQYFSSSSSHSSYNAKSNPSTGSISSSSHSSYNAKSNPSTGSIPSLSNSNYSAESNPSTSNHLSPHFPFDNLFSGIKGQLTKRGQDLISTTLKSMTLETPAERPSLSEARALFEQAKYYQHFSKQVLSFFTNKSLANDEKQGLLKACVKYQ